MNLRLPVQLVTLAAGIGLVGGGALLPWIEVGGHGATIFGIAVGFPVVAIVGVAIGLAGGWQASLAAGYVRHLPRRQAGGVLAVILLGSLGLAGSWYGYLLNEELRPYEYRANVRMLLLLAGAAMIAAVRPTLDLGPLLHRALRAAQRFGIGKVAGLLATAVVLLSAAIGGVVLEGMPHMSDALTYLLQGRNLWSGYLALKAPANPELFHNSLFFNVTDSGLYVGKYPWGWPVVLGLFDRFHIAWLAAPLLAGGLVLAACRLVAREAGARLALLFGIFFAGCPWLWYNAATQMSHVASAFWLILFLTGFQSARNHQSVGRGLLAGLALGAAIMTRPQDAFFFSIPCVLLAAGRVVSDYRRWLPVDVAIAAGASLGVVLYLGLNRLLLGNPATTGYRGATPVEALFAQSPQSFIEWLSWAQESWVALNLNACVAGLPAGIGIVAALIFARRRARRMALLLACSSTMFVGYTVFIFVSRPWVGPRWLFVVLPAMAYLAACGVSAALDAARQREPIAPVARFYLRLVGCSLVVIWFVVFPATLIQLWSNPPHLVDGRVVEAVSEAELSNAVVALPVESTWEEYGRNNYKDPRAGMWKMQIPFEDSPVIFVRQIENWQNKAHRSFPGRKLYRMSAEPGDFRLYPADSPPQRPRRKSDTSHSNPTMASP